MKQRYYSFDELVDMIDEPNRKLCCKIYLDNKDIFEFAKGSNVKHHYWEGGVYWAFNRGYEYCR